MLTAHAELFPEAVDALNFFYGTSAPVFVFDAHGDLIQLASEEGSRQGCAAGTEAFCLTIHRIVSRIQKLYPDYIFRVLTDDLIPLVPPPATDSNAEWQLTYARYAKFLADLRRISREEAGLTLNIDKGGLLIPDGAPPPSASVLSLFEAGFQFRSDGFRIAGAPIGTAAFMQQFTKAKVAEATAKVL